MTDSLVSPHKSLGGGGEGGVGGARGAEFLLIEDQKLVICIVSLFLLNLSVGIHANVKSNQLLFNGDEVRSAAKLA